MAEVAAYPDRAQAELVDRLSERLRLLPREIMIGGSASDLLRAVFAAYAPGRKVLLPAHTYEEYRHLALACRGEPVSVPMPDLRLPVDRLVSDMPRGGMVVLAHPAAPTGEHLGATKLAPLVEAAERRRALLVLDESYLPFVPGGRSVAGQSSCLLTVFSWSKMLGCPGLPLAHAVGDPQVLEAMRVQTLPWSTGPFARHLGLLTLDHEKWVVESLSRVERTASKVRAALGSSSATHYFTVQVVSASECARRLRARGFAVRDLTSMGLPGHVRFSVRKEAPTLQFLRALRSELPARSIPAGLRSWP